MKNIIIKNKINKIFKEFLFEHKDEDYMFIGFEEQFAKIEFYESYVIRYSFSKLFIPYENLILPEYKEEIFDFNFEISQKEHDDCFYDKKDYTYIVKYDTKGNSDDVAKQKQIIFYRNLLLKSKLLSLKQKIEIVTILKRYNVINNVENIKFN